MLVSSQCTWCIHRHIKRKDGWPVCDAFLDGIPEDLLHNRIKHKTPYPGDNGIQWEPKEKYKKILADRERRKAEKNEL